MNSLCDLSFRFRRQATNLLFCNFMIYVCFATISMVLWACSGKEISDVRWIWRTPAGRSGLLRCVVQSSDMGYLVVGQSDCFEDASCGLVARITSSGKIVWTRVIPQAVLEWVEPFGSDMLWAAGMLRDTTRHTRLAYIIELDEDGNTNWTRTIAVNGVADISNILVLPEGGAMAVGYTETLPDNNQQGLLIKMSADGDTLWSRTFGGSGQERFVRALLLEDGNYALLGTTTSNANSFEEYYVVKIDKEGILLWEHSYGTGDRMEIGGVATNGRSGIIISGSTHGRSGGNDYIWLVSIGLNGDSLWTRKLGGDATGSWFGRDLLRTTNGYSLAACIRGKMTLLGLTQGGDTVWTHIYLSSEVADPRSAQQTSEGGYVIAGNAVPSAWHSRQEMVLVKTAPGDREW